MHYLFLIIDLFFRYQYSITDGELLDHEDGTWYNSEFTTLKQMKHWESPTLWLSCRIVRFKSLTDWVGSRCYPNHESLSTMELFIWHTASMVMPFSLVVDMGMILVIGTYSWMNTVVPFFVGTGLSIIFIESESKRVIKERKMDISGLLPEFLTMLSLYVHAGLTPYNAWKKSVETTTRDGRTLKTMRTMITDDKYHGREKLMYSEMAKAIKDIRMDRLTGLLENSSIYGDHEFSMKLDRMKSEIRGERVKLIRIKAEEAKVRLMIPLFMNLVSILALIMVPIVTALKSVFA